MYLFHLTFKKYYITAQNSLKKKIIRNLGKLKLF